MRQNKTSVFSKYGGFPSATAGPLGQRGIVRLAWVPYAARRSCPTGLYRSFRSACSAICAQCWAKLSRCSVRIRRIHHKYGGIIEQRIPKRSSIGQAEVIAAFVKLAAFVPMFWLNPQFLFFIIQCSAAPSPPPLELIELPVNPVLCCRLHYAPCLAILLNRMLLYAAMIFE